MPTSPEARRVALENKNRMEEIQRRRKEGHAPTNKQMEYFIDEAEGALRKEEAKVPEEGRKVLKDTERVLEDTKEMMEARNRDETLQRIGEHATRASKKSTLRRDPALKPMPEEKELVRLLLNDVKDLVKILVSSRNFRKTAIEFMNILREIAQKEKEELKIEGAEGRTEEEKKQILKEKLKQKTREENLSSLKEKAPVEKRRSLEHRVNELLSELSDSYTTQEFIRHLYSLFDHMSARQKTIKEKGKVELEKSKTEVDSMLMDLRSFVAQFTSPETLHDLETSFREVRTLLRQDSDLKHIAVEWRNMGSRTMNEPGRKYTTEEISDLLDRTRVVLHEKRNAEPMAKLLRALQYFVHDIHEDPYRQKLSKDIKILVRDLLYDSQGNFSLNDRAISQIRRIIVPSLVDQLKYVALPTIENDSKSQYVLVRDVVLKISDILPDHIDIKMKSDATLQTKHLSLEKPHNKIKFDMRDVEVHIREADVYVKRHTFPKIEDEFKLNVDVYGKKNIFKWKLKVETRRDAATGHDYAIFKVDSTYCKIHHLHLKASQGKHDTLINVMSTILNPLIKKNMEREIQKNLFQTLKKVCNMLNDVSRRVPQMRERAKSTVKTQGAKLKPKKHGIKQKIQQAVPGKMEQKHEERYEPSEEYEISEGYYSEETEPSEVWYRGEEEEYEVPIAEEVTKVQTPEGAEYEERTGIYSEQSLQACYKPICFFFIAD